MYNKWHPQFSILRYTLHNVSYFGVSPPPKILIIFSTLLKKFHFKNQTNIYSASKIRTMLLNKVGMILLCETNVNKLVFFVRNAN